SCGLWPLHEACRSGLSTRPLPFFFYLQLSLAILSQLKLSGLIDLIRLKPAFNLHINNPKHRLTEDMLAHLGTTLGAVCKNDGNFDDSEAHFPCGKLHFYLEGVAYKFDFVQIDRFKHFSAIAFKSCGGVFDGYACDKLYILAGKK